MVCATPRASVSAMSEIPLLAQILLALVMSGSGVLLFWVARAAARGRLRRNMVAGIRTRATLASDEAWLAAHRRAERPTRLAGWASIVTGLCAFVPADLEGLVWVVLLIGTAVMLGLVVYGAKLGHDAARELGDGR